MHSPFFLHALRFPRSEDEEGKKASTGQKRRGALDANNNGVGGGQASYQNATPAARPVCQWRGFASLIRGTHAWGAIQLTLEI